MGVLRPWEGKINVRYKSLNASIDENIACYKWTDCRERAKKCDKERQRGGGDGDFSTVWLLAALHGYLSAWNMLTKRHKDQS